MRTTRPATRPASRPRASWSADGASCIAGSWASSVTRSRSRARFRSGRACSRSRPPRRARRSPTSKTTVSINRTPPADNLQGPALADTVEEQLGGAEGKTISVAGRNDSYGDGLTASFTTAWEAKGGEVDRRSGALRPEAATYDSEAQQITADDADGYVIVDFPETFVKVGPALVRTGNWDPDEDVRHRRTVSGDSPRTRRTRRSPKVCAEPRRARPTEGDAVGGIRQVVHVGGSEGCRSSDVRRPELRRRDALLSGSRGRRLDRRPGHGGCSSRT